MQQNSFQLRLTSAAMITPRVMHMVFEPVMETPFEFIPGQFITFHFTLDNEIFQRSYSIASIPSETKQIEIAVAPYEGGPGTRKLFSMKLGDLIETTGPFGRLILRDETPDRLILIATGTGVTPYRAMLPEIINRLKKQNLTALILLGVQSPAELLYGSDFLRYAEKHDNLQFHTFYSREMPEASTPQVHHGYVQTAFEWIDFNPEKDVVYLCGNPDMIDEAFAKLREIGFDTRQVRREKYISPKQR